jgi:hypothetical protein
MGDLFLYIACMHQRCADACDVHFPAGARLASSTLAVRKRRTARHRRGLTKPRPILAATGAAGGASPCAGRRPPPGETWRWVSALPPRRALIVRRRFLMGRLFLGLTVFSAILLVAATFLFVLLLPV